MQAQSRVERNRAAAERRRSRAPVSAAAHAQREAVGAVRVLNFQISVIARRVRFERKPAIAGNRQRPFGTAENRAVNRAVLAVPVIPRSNGRIRRERDVPVNRRAAIHRKRTELFPDVHGKTRVAIVAATAVLSRETAPVENKIRVSADEIRVRGVDVIRHAHLRTGRDFDGRVFQRVKIADAVEIFPDEQTRVALDSDRAVERFRLRKQNCRNFGVGDRGEPNYILRNRHLIYAHDDGSRSRNRLMNFCVVVILRSVGAVQRQIECSVFADVNGIPRRSDPERRI